MPLYDYRCDDCGAFRTAHLGMFDAAAVMCTGCNRPMRRAITSMPRVNWGGLSPSQGELAPAVRAVVDDPARVQDEFLELHEQHERNTREVSSE